VRFIEDTRTYLNTCLGTKQRNGKWRCLCVTSIQLATTATHILFHLWWRFKRWRHPRWLTLGQCTPSARTQEAERLRSSGWLLPLLRLEAVPKSNDGQLGYLESHFFVVILGSSAQMLAQDFKSGQPRLLPHHFQIIILLRRYKPLYLLKPSGHYMHHQFNIHKLYVLLTQCIHVFCCVDLRTNCDYFPVQH
jgi:hypothetical protein